MKEAALNKKLKSRKGDEAALDKKMSLEEDDNSQVHKYILYSSAERYLSIVLVLGCSTY